MRAGDIISGRFRLESIAGRGGMGEVWRAIDLEREQRVALKALLAVRKEERPRILREALALASLDHPNIVRYIAHGELPTEVPYLVMEWLEGEELSARIERGPLSIEGCLQAIRVIAQALSYMHQRGVVHRDIKPSNIWLVGGELRAIKLLDFGLVQIEDDLGKLTKAGLFIGTPSYTSPEQAHALQTVDARADLFSLGCVAFECLTGQTPFSGEGSLSIMLKILLEEPPLLRDLRPEAPAELEALISQLLEKEPQRRPQSAEELATRLATMQPSSAPVLRGSLTEQERQFICVMLAKDIFAPKSQEKTLIQEPSWAGESKSSSSQETRFLLRDLQELVSEHGGRLFPVAGGALAVLFRGGVATDQAQKAGRCALALQQRAPLAKVALAIHRGATRSPLGEVIESAAALLREAPQSDAGIFLDATSAGLFEGNFEISDEGPRLMLHADRPLSLTKKTLLGRPTPYMGRARELSWLLEVAEDAFNDKEAKIVTVTAEAGMGKSRLLLEFWERVTQRPEAPLVLFAQADPVRGGSPFSLLSSALRRLAGIVEGEPLAAQQRKLQVMVSRHVSQSSPSQPNIVRLSGGLSLKPAVTSYPTQTRVTEFLGELCGVRFPDEKSSPLRMARQSAHVMGEQMRRALEDWLSAEASARPIILVLEDLHIGDLPSVSFLDSALYRLRRAPFFLLSLARPELHAVFPGLWASHQPFELPLSGISEEEGRDFVRRVLGDKVSEEVAAQLAARARGNPFYLEELCRSVSTGDTKEFPETILAMTQHRVERLSAEQRRVLRAASVFGESFWPGGVERLLGGLERGALEEALSALLEEELLTLRPEGQFSQEPEYRFHHALWREALYASLTAEDLELGHGLAAEWLLEMQESDAWTLAEHFARGPEPQRASAWYARSAEQSFEGNDLNTSLLRIQRAIQCGVTEEARGVLSLLEAEVLLWQGRYQESSQCFSEAMELLPRGGLRWYKSTAGLVVNSLYLGRYDLLMSLIETLREEEPQAEVSGLYATATSTIVIFSCVAGVYSVASEFLSRLESLLKRHTSLDPTLHAWTSFSQCYNTHFIQGDPNAFYKVADDAVAGFAQIGDLRAMSSALTELGRAHAQLGEYDEAERALRLALEQAERLGIGFVSPVAKQFLASVLSARGEHQEAKRLRAKALTEFRAQNNKQMEGQVLIEQAALLLQEGEADAARQLTEEALSLMEMVPPFRARSLARLAETYLEQGEHAKALEHAKEAKELLDSLGGCGYGEAFIWAIYLKALLTTKSPELPAERARAQQRLLDRANTLPDEKRVRFLREVPENAYILSL